MAPWVKITSDEQAQPYYFNPETQATSWTLPRGEEATWISQNSPEGNAYYLNRLNGETSWELPSAQSVPVQVKVAPATTEGRRKPGSKFGSGGAGKLQKRREALRKQLRAGGVAPLVGLEAELKAGAAALATSADVNLRRATSQGVPAKGLAVAPDLTKTFGKKAAEAERWKTQKTGDGYNYHVDTVTGLTAWDIPAALLAGMKASTGPGAMKQNGQVITLHEGRVAVKGPDGKSGALIPLDSSLPVNRGVVANPRQGVPSVAPALHVDGQCILKKSGDGNSPMLEVLRAFLSQGSASSTKYSFAQPSVTPTSIRCSSATSGPPIFITLNGAAGAGTAVARRCTALGKDPLLLGFDNFAFHSAVESLYAVSRKPQLLSTTDDGGSTWRPFLRPRTRPAAKSRKNENADKARRAKDLQAAAGPSQQMPFQDMQIFQQQAQQAAWAQAQVDAQAAAERMSQEWMAQQAAAQAEAAQAQAAARAQSTQALLSFMAQSQAKDLAAMGAAMLDDTPLMHAGVSSMNASQLRGVLHEPSYELSFLYEFQYSSMCESASQVEPRAAQGKTDLVKAADKEAQKEGGCIGRGVRIRGSTSSGYSFYDMTQMAGGAPTGQKIARTGTVQALLP